MNLSGFKRESAGTMAAGSAIYLHAQRKGSRHKLHSTLSESKWRFFIRGGLRPICYMNVLGGGLVFVMDKTIQEGNEVERSWEWLKARYRGFSNRD